MLATWHWHIEISSKCTLQCPRCARQEVPNGLVNTELDLEFFKRNFTPEFVLSNVEKITFCGDDGDPIYAHDLIPVIRYIKSIKPVEIVIVTNGSYKKIEWWHELGLSLTEQDTVHFSVDGWDNASNNQYRVNSDFESIMTGIRTLKSHSLCRLVWDAILFRFNEDRIDHMQTLARQLGMDGFQLTQSTKFGHIYKIYGQDDPLKPSSQSWTDTTRYKREMVKLSERGLNDAVSATNLRLYQQAMERPLMNFDSVIPLCEIGNKGLYIDAQGRLFPCCWVANRYNHNSEWQTLANQFNLRERTLLQVLDDSFWFMEFQKFNWSECKTKCTPVLLFDQKYATDW